MRSLSGATEFSGCEVDGVKDIRSAGSRKLTNDSFKFSQALSRCLRFSSMIHGTTMKTKITYISSILVLGMLVGMLLSPHTQHLRMHQVQSVVDCMNSFRACFGVVCAAFATLQTCAGQCSRRGGGRGTSPRGCDPKSFCVRRAGVHCAKEMNTVNGGHGFFMLFHAFLQSQDPRVFFVVPTWADSYLHFVFLRIHLLARQ